MDQRGISIIEVLLVIALIAIVASFAMTANFDSFQGHGFRDERDTLIGLLHTARSHAMNSICLGADCTEGKSHGVFIQTDSVTHSVQHYVLFQGSSYGDRDSVFDAVTIPQHVIIASGMSEFVFTQLSGNPTATSIGSITMSDPNGAHQGSLASTISINAEAQITWTN
jgi:prepilin-type N-terminal cleavage/methylation domain-containing protein